MQVEYPDGHPLSPADLAHLQQLRALVEQALEDGRLSRDELDRIRTLVNADHQVTVEELQVIHQTVRAVLGDAVQFDWEPYRHP